MLSWPFLRTHEPAQSGYELGRGSSSEELGRGYFFLAQLVGELPAAR